MKGHRSLDYGIPSRIVGIDYGTRRVGVAIADPLRMFAQPYGVYSQTAALQYLEGLHARESITTIVIGWPLLESGEVGIAAARVQEYVTRLKKAIPEAEVVRWDERYTSQEAAAMLREQGRSFHRSRVDTAAAGIILQQYLDERWRQRAGKMRVME